MSAPARPPDGREPDGRTGGGIAVRTAATADAAAIAALTRRAFASQAELYGDDTLPPLGDTAESVAAEIAGGTRVLVAELDERIVGAVRGSIDAASGTCHVGRLVVDPGLQRRGIGRTLATRLEACVPEARRFEIFTGHLSAPALALYESLGYVRERIVPVHDRLSLVFLGKPGPAGHETGQDPRS